MIQDMTTSMQCKWLCKCGALNWGRNRVRCIRCGQSLVTDSVTSGTSRPTHGRHVCREDGCRTTFELARYNPHTAWMIHRRDWHDEISLQSRLTAITVGGIDHVCPIECKGRVRDDENVPLGFAEPRPDKGLNPYFVHPDDTSGWPSGPHCAMRGTQDCIQCTPADDHVHKSTELWRLDADTGEVKRRRVTCYAPGFDGDHDWRLEWFDSAQDKWRHGGYTNADAVFDGKRCGWTDVRVDALKQQVEWWLRRVNELGEAATKAMADARRAEQRAFSVFDELERECRREE